MRLNIPTHLLLAVLKANNPDKFRDRMEQTNLMDIDPDKLPPELLDKIANRMIEQALAANGVQDTAAVIAEVDRRLASGEPVTFEAVCQAVNGPTRTMLEPAESQKS